MARPHKTNARTPYRSLPFKWDSLRLETLPQANPPEDGFTGPLSSQKSGEHPQGLIACSTNEVLTEITIEFSKENPAGELYTSQTIRLTDANIVEIQRFTRAQDGTLLLAEVRSETLELETWAFTFRKIEVDDNPTKISFVDDWSVTT